MGTTGGMVIWEGYEQNAKEFLDTGSRPPWKMYLPYLNVWDFLETEDCLLIATSDGLYQATGYGHDLKLKNKTPGSFLLCLETDGQGHLLAGSAHDGVLYFKNDDYSNPEQYMGDHLVHTIALSPNGQDILAGTLEGLYRLRLPLEPNKTRNKLLLPGIINSITISSDKKIFLCTPDGVSIFSEGSNGLVNQQDFVPPCSLSNDNINCLAPDGLGGVFLGTKWKGTFFTP